MQYEKLNGYLESIEPEAIKIAIDKTNDNGAKTFSYMEAILKDWKKKGYKTKQQVDHERGTEEYEPIKEIEELVDYDWLGGE